MSALRLVAVAFLILVASGCTPAKTPSEQCRTQNAWRRVGRANNPDPRLDAVEDIRCDEMEREEHREARADAKEKAAQEAQAEVKAASTSAAIDAKLAEIRASPKIPELGSTVAEAKVLCEQQRGSFMAPNEKGIYGCTVGQRPIFVCTEKDGFAIIAEAFYEGADLGTVVRQTEQAFGPPEKQTVGDDGMRVFHWSKDALGMRIRMYQHGVRIMFIQRR